MRQKIRSSFRLQLTFTVVLAIVIPVLIVMAYITYLGYQSIEDNANAHLAEQAAILAQSTIDYDQASVLALQNMSQQPAITSMDPKLQEPALVNMANVYETMYLIFTTNSAGTNVARSDRGEPDNYVDRAWFQNAASGKEIYRQSIVSRTTSEPAIAYSAPIKQAGQVVGVAFAGTELTTLAEVVGAISIGETGFAYIVDSEGYVLAHPDPALTTGELADLSRYPPVALALSNVSGNYTFTSSEDDIDWYAAIQPLDNGWSIIVQQQRTEALAELPAFLVNALIITSIIIGLVGTLIYIAAGRAVQPIENLTEAATAVSEGQLNKKVETERSDEVGSLAKAFNTMTNQIRDLVNNLETRVAEQTRDLSLASELGRDISQIRDTNELLTTAVERIRSRFDLYYAQIYLTNEDGTRLDLRAGTGMVGESLLAKGLQLNVDARSINGQAALEKHPIIVPDTSRSPLFRPNPALPYTRSEMAIPLLVGDQVLGVLDLQSITPGGLSEENLSAFETLAGQLAIALQNAALFKGQERLAQELQENTEQFQENAKFLDSVIENLPNMLFVKDAKDLRYVRWNKAGSKLVGIPAETFIGKTDYDFFPEHEAEFFVQKDREVLNNGILVDIPEETIETTDKGQRLLHTIKVPILDTAGEPQYLLGISQDITEQKNAEHMLNERLKELNLLNEISRKMDEQPSLEEFLTYTANRVPTGMQHTELCKVAIKIGEKVYGAPEAIELPSQIVEGLRIDDEQIGRIYIAYTEKQDFVNEESALIGSIGRRVTDYIVNRRLLDRVQATVEGLQTVAEVGTAITSQQDTQHLLQNVVDLTKDKFGFYHAHIYLYDELLDALVLSAGAGDIGRQMVNESRQIALSAPRSLVARAARERQVLVVGNVRQDPGFLAHPLLPETRSEMAVPLVVGSTLIGVMDIQSSEINGFTPEDVNIQSTLASQIAVALQNAQQYEQTQAALEEVNALQRALTREGWQAYMTATERAIQGYKTTESQLQPIQKEESLAANGNGNDNQITYPISVRGTAIGQIGVDLANKRIDQDDLALLEAISDQVAEALERARLFEETETARNQTEALFSGSQQVVRATNMTEILNAIVESTELGNYAIASMFFFDHSLAPDDLAEMITLTAVWRKDGQPSVMPLGTTFPINQYPVFNYLNRETPLFIHDVAQDDRFDDNIRALFINQLDMRSVLAVPLVVGDTWLGVIMGTTNEPQHLTEAQIRQIVSLVGQAATVAQSQRLFQDAQTRAQREQILREVSARVSAAVDAESVLQTATREIGRALGLETFVYLKKPQTEQ